MAFLKLGPPPVKEAISNSGSIGLFISSRWLPWLSKLSYIIDVLSPSVGADVGDADVTLTVGSSARTQIFNTALTAPRTITLSTTNAFNGAEFEIIRRAAATGASGLDVGGLKTLAVGQGCIVAMDNTGWFLKRFWSL